MQQRVLEVVHGEKSGNEMRANFGFVILHTNQGYEEMVGQSLRISTHLKICEKLRNLQVK